MSMKYLSIYLCLHFLSSLSYSFQCIGLFTSFIKFILRYFILFDAIVTGTVFSISLSHSSLLVCRYAVDICILILYPAALLNSNFFWCRLYGFLYINIMSSANNECFTSCLLIWMPFIYRKLHEFTYHPC